MSHHKQYCSIYQLNQMLLLFSFLQAFAVISSSDGPLTVSQLSSLLSIMFSTLDSFFNFFYLQQHFSMLVNWQLTDKHWQIDEILHLRCLLQSIFLVQTSLCFFLKTFTTFSHFLISASYLKMLFLHWVCCVVICSSNCWIARLAILLTSFIKT